MNSTPRRILLVDDHQDTLDLFAIALSQQDYEVVTASSIDGALQETKDQQFHLVILDSWVGDGSGVDLCRSISIWLKQIVTSSDVQIVPPSEAIYSNFSFARDGNYIYFNKREQN